MGARIIRCVSVKQPSASLIIVGQKRYETRSWSTAHRGLLAIHASARFDEEDQALCRYDPFRTALAGADRPLPCGAVLGVVRLKDCIPSETLRSDPDRYGLTIPELRFGNFSDERFGWEVEVVERFATPYPARGSLGLWGWKVPPDLLGRAYL